MSNIDNFISLFVPHECIGCGAEGWILCRQCTTDLPQMNGRCYSCERLSTGGFTCAACPQGLRRVQSATLYSGLAKDLLWGLKSGGIQSAVRPMAYTMRNLLPTNAVLVPVPTATGRIRQRGYDQALLLTKELSRQTGLPYRKLLTRRGQAHQVGASRATRKQQLAGAYTAKTAKGLRIVLIDDVMTTGATLEAAATVLQKAGAGQIDALTFAQA